MGGKKGKNFTIASFKNVGRVASVVLLLKNLEPKWWKWPKLLQITVVLEMKVLGFFFTNIKTIKGESILKCDIYHRREQKI